MDEIKLIMSADDIKRKMKIRMKLFTIASILLFIATTAFMFLGFYHLEPSRINLCYISFVIMIGYLMGVLCWDNYLKEWRELKCFEQEIEKILDSY